MGEIGQFTQDIRGFLGGSLDRFAQNKQLAQAEYSPPVRLGGYIQGQLADPLDRLAQVRGGLPGGGSWGQGAQGTIPTLDWLSGHGTPFRNPYAPQQPQYAQPGQSSGPGSYPQPGPAPSSAPTYTGLPQGVAQWADQATSTFGDQGGWVPAAMLAIIQHESSGSPTAYNAAGDAHGLFQQVGLNSTDPNAQFAAAKQLLGEKLAMINASYQRLGINPDERTRARDLFLAWAGQFDPATAGPNSNRDIGNGQDANAFLNGPQGIMPMYDNIVKGRQQPQAAGGGDWGGGLIGTPYAVGGLRAHPNAPQQGLDCSEFTAYVWGQKGVALPWNAQQQYNNTARVDAGHLQPGDLVFFQGTDPSDPDYVTHVGIYVGGGKMINSQDNGVQYADLSSPYWQQHLAGYGRVAATTGGGTTNR